MHKINRGLSVLLVTAISMTAATTNAFGYCSEPDAPDPPASYSKPDVPFCLGDYAWSGEHTCDDWELENYFSEVEDYVRKLQDYLEDVDDYRKEAFEFAKCMAEEVQEQHE